MRALLVALLCCGAASARADLISAEIGSELATARKVAWVRAEPADAQHRVHGVVIEPLRGVTKGERIELFTIGEPLPTGLKLLWWCGNVCGVGVPHGDAYLLQANAMMPTAIYPGFVEARAVRSLLDQRPAPKVCARVKLHFADAPDRAVELRGEFEAKNGEGSLSGPILEQTKARWFFGSGGTSLGMRDVSISFGEQQVMLLGAPAPVERDGCWALDVIQRYPLARTPRSFAAAQKGARPITRIAEGFLERDGKREKIWLELGGDHDLVIRGTKVSDPMPYRRFAGTLSFPIADGRYLGLAPPGFDAALAASPADDFYVALASLLKKTTILRGEVRMHGENPQLPGDAKVVGRFELRYVPE